MNPFFQLAYGVRERVRQMFRATKSGQGSLKNPPLWMREFFGGSSEDYAGVTVDENTAMQYIAFWSCIKVIRETIASLPQILYKRTSNGKERAVRHPAFNVFHLKANPEQAAYDYKEMIANHYMLCGNAYSEKIYDNSGFLKEVWPLMPWNMEVVRISGKKYFRYRLPDNKIHTFLADQIIHLKNFSSGGLVGDRPLDYAHHGVGMGIAADEYGARFFSNDSAPGGLIEMPGHLKKDSLERFKASWEKNYGSLSNKHRTAILEDGAKFHELTISPEKAQFLETRKFQRQMMASFHRLPPHLIGDLENATYSNIEEQSLEFIQYTMLPHFVRWEQNYTIQTLTEKEQKKYYYEILVDGLLRGDLKTRYEAYKIGREGGWLSPDDVRGFENMNKLPNRIGEKYHIPMNWAELGAEPVEPEPQQEPEEPEDPGQEEEPEEESQEEENAIKLLKEQRTLRAAMTRKNIANSYRPIHEDIIRRIQKRERVDITRKVKKWLTTRSVDAFNKWYREYYDELTPYIQRQLAPAYDSINTAIMGEIRQEINRVRDDENQEEFVKSYIEVYVRKYILDHKRNIGLALSDIEKNEKQVDERFEEMFDGWERNLRNDSHDEVVKSSNAFAKNIYLLAGIAYLRWVNTGGNPCPYCEAMDGSIVGIDQSFMAAGSNITEGEDRLNISKDVGHAPLHSGCECQIMAG